MRFVAQLKRTEARHLGANPSQRKQGSKNLIGMESIGLVGVTPSRTRDLPLINFNGPSTRSILSASSLS